MLPSRSTRATRSVLHFGFIALLAIVLAKCGGTASISPSSMSATSPTTSAPTAPTSTPSPGTGSPTPPDPPPALNTGAEFLYAIAPADNNQSTFTIYQVNQDTGELSLVNTATIPVGAAQNIAVDSTGTNFYVTGLGATGTDMDLVKVDPSAHAITALPGQAFQTLSQFAGEGDCCPNTVAVDGSGKFAYIGGLNDGWIHVYAVDPNSGTWNEISRNNSPTPAGGSAVSSIAMHPTNKFLYESQGASNLVSIWARDQHSGLISPIAESPFQTSAPTSVSISSDGKYLLVPHAESGQVSVYTVNKDGSLSELEGSPVATGNAPTRAVMDPQDRFFFVLNGGSNIGGPASVQSFTVDQKSGAISAVPNSTFTVYTVGQIRVDAGGKFLYALGGQTMAWSIDQTTGALSTVQGSPFKIVATDAMILQQSTAGTE